MSRWIIAIIVLTLITATGVGAWQWQKENLIEPLTFDGHLFEPLLNQITETGEILTPEPLRGPLTGLRTTLTTAGVLSETNRHRIIYDLPALRANTTLDVAAQKKVVDMFAQQYFAHEAPDGTGPADLVESVKYEYIRVGENLALGNFASDTALVQAWMDSPGHRENILHSGFTEIGLAVGEGLFEGTRVWLAVQTFAAPLSSCPAVDPALQKQFDQQKAALDQLAQQLEAQKNELESLQAQLESLATEVKQLAQAGDQKIKEGNAEIDRGNKVYEDTGDRNQAQPYWDRGEALQKEGEALLEQAKQKQSQYNTLYSSYEDKLKTYNAEVDAQRQQNETINAIMSRLNQQIRAFNECIK